MSMKVCQYFKQNQLEIAQEITKQMGKPLSQAQQQVQATISRIKTLSNFAKTQLLDQTIKDDNLTLKYFTKQPKGVIMTILPWNYPILLASNSIIPAFLAGNSVLIKHSPITPHCAKRYVQAFKYAGAPDYLINDFFIEHQLSDTLYDRNKIQGVTFTGSVGGGQDLLKAISSTSLLDCDPIQLSGKDAALVFQDADLDLAASKIVDGAYYNAGQSCCSIERIYIHQSIYQQFLQRLVALSSSQYKIGDPMQQITSIGPMARVQAPYELQQMVNQAQDLGGQVLCGGKAIQDQNGCGSFFPPTIVKQVNNGMQIMTEQTFGPMFGAQSMKNQEQAIKQVNSSSFAISASIFTQDIDKARRLSKDLNVGTVFLNTCELIDSKLPWSGRKLSGHGISLSRLCFSHFYRTKSFNFIKPVVK